jgi:hypothetical protein
MMAYAINLKTAAYDSSGIVNATWDLLALNGNAGFLVRIDWRDGFNSWFVRDPAAVAIALPMQFDKAYSSYTLTLFGLQDADDVNQNVYSAALPVSGWPLS